MKILFLILFIILPFAVQAQDTLKVYRITEAQKDSLRGKQWAPSSNFSPAKDKYNLWYIGEEEVELMDYNWALLHNLLWVKELEKVLYEPAPMED